MRCLEEVLACRPWAPVRGRGRACGRRWAGCRKPYDLGLLATGRCFVISGLMPNTVAGFGVFLVLTLGHSSIGVFSLSG
ncbi:hypothetical protein [Streptomyces sp. RG80]|uniref:hypothetical protein n=1 Tax=Streptomyces sp. RG80 TaxID=3157340 RepID=UPI00338E1060